MSAFLDTLHPLHPVLCKVFLHAALIVFPIFFHRGECVVMYARFCTHHSISGPLWGLAILASWGTQLLEDYLCRARLNTLSLL